MITTSSTTIFRFLSWICCISRRGLTQNGGDLSLGYCETKTVNEVVPAAAGAIPRQRRLHRRLVAQLRGLQPDPEKYQDKTVVIPFGLEQHDVQHDPQRVAHWRETVGDNFFLFVGAFRYYKGLHILLDAAERSRLPVVIVGGGPLEAEVRREAQQRGLSNVVFTGMLNDEDKYILFQLCRGVVFPSHLRSEAFGITLLEGARFARPLISCEIGTGTSFINQDKVSGCVIPPNDSQALVEAMNELWNNEETSNRYGENSRRRFEEMFTADHMIDAYVNLYTTLLESKS